MKPWSKTGAFGFCIDFHQRGALQARCLTYSSIGVLQMKVTSRSIISSKSNKPTYPLSVLVALAIGFAACFLPSVFAQVCSSCQVSQQTVTNADALLNLDDSAKADAEARHLLSGRPVAPSNATNEHMIHQQEWITWYDDDLRVPLWVAYELTKADASADRFLVGGNWRTAR